MHDKNWTILFLLSRTKNAPAVCAGRKKSECLRFTHSILCFFPSCTLRNHDDSF